MNISESAVLVTSTHFTDFQIIDYTLTMSREEILADFQVCFTGIFPTT